MSDPIEQLRNFTPQGVDVTPLSPSEVRRRGDRLRRRNQALAAVGGVAAIALIATPIALLAGGPPKALQPVDTPTPTTTQTPTSPPTAATESPQPTRGDIPAGFPLAAGFPDPSQAEEPEKALQGPNRTLAPVEYSACGQPVPDPGHADRVVAKYENAEDYRTRSLTTYPDADAAVAAVQAMVGAWQSCPEDPVRTDGFVTHREVRRLNVGGESWAILERDTMDGGASPFGATTVLVRLGRAIFIEDRAGHAGYPSGDGQASIDDVIDGAAEPLAAMCAFTEAGCGGGGASAPADGIIGPQGSGDLQMGMTVAQLEATGLVTMLPAPADSNCVPFTVDTWLADDPRSLSQVDGYVSRKLGLAILIAQPEMHTPEGISIGSTVAEVRTAYGELTGQEAYSTRPIDGVEYFFLTNLQEKVDEFQVELEGQDCVH